MGPSPQHPRWLRAGHRPSGPSQPVCEPGPGLPACTPPGLLLAARLEGGGSVAGLGGCPPGIFSVPGRFAPSRTESQGSFPWGQRPVLRRGPLQTAPRSCYSPAPLPSAVPKGWLSPRLASSALDAPRACVPAARARCGVRGGTGAPVSSARLWGGASVGAWAACQVEVAGPDVSPPCPTCL